MWCAVITRGRSFGEKADVKARDREPLVVDDVSGRLPAEAQHVRHVLDQLASAPSRSVQPARGAAPVEALRDPVAVCLRHRPVEEVAGQQLHVHAGTRQRRGKRAVVGRRERRRIHQLHVHRGRLSWWPWRPALSYCIVNTNGREHLLACLDAIERTHPAGVEREILVLDNASTDGSAEAVRARGGDIRLIELKQTNR